VKVGGSVRQGLGASRTTSADVLAPSIAGWSCRSEPLKTA
jgi:hypothetical protein